MPFLAPTTLTGIRRARLIVGDSLQMADFLIDIHDSYTRLDVDGQHARFLGVKRYDTPSGEANTSRGLPTQIASYADLSLTVEPVMDAGYTCDSVYIRCGYDLDGPEFRHGNRQWKQYRTTVKASKQYALNVPANNITACLRIRADFYPKAVCNHHIVFDDEFNDDDLTLASPERWRTSDRQGAAWNRFISSDPRVSHVEDGTMAMRCFKDGDTFISGAKDTRGHFSFTHGYVEARIMTTPHTGNFPAFWLMPDDQSEGWPTCGEIDIWETINMENRSYQTVHSNWTYNLGRTGNPQSSFNRWTVQAGEYHYYGLKKEAGLLTWYVDGDPVCSYADLDTDDSRYHKQWPFERRFYIIINQSVGTGSWAAAPDDAFEYKTFFDHVRCYQTPEQLEADQNADGLQNTKFIMHNYWVCDLSGRRLPAPQRGIHIVRDADGTARKVLVPKK